jgi:6-pyruvoyltetrahydropterin/6-carboxytetrahydropterin synthase
LILIVKRDFDAAHYLENYQGKCANLHGHRWVVEVYLNVPDDNDLTIDFGDAKKIIDSKLPDHQCLNDLYDFNPTAENIVKHLKSELKKELPIEKLIIWESPSSGAMI